MKIIHQQFAIRYSYHVVFTRDVFHPGNPVLANTLMQSGRKPCRVLIVLDSNVRNATPGLLEKIEQYACRHTDRMDIVAPPFIIEGGEGCKKDAGEVNKIHALVNKEHLCRHSFILAIGGGAVLDAAGYAAATAHRGIRLIRMPTTTLAQNDAGVGVKNAINAFGRKNFIGTFAPPFSVISDFGFLETLPSRHKRAGIVEAVKVALMKDRQFFDYLFEHRQELASFVPETMEQMVVRCAELHIEHIGNSGDPFEQGSTRPLDFGHWSAHKIEELTDGEVQHGEAVAIGIALDALYSCRTGLISEIESQKIFSTLEDIGFDLYHWSLSWMDIDRAIREFQEHIGGDLQIPLLNGLGQKIDVTTINIGLLKECVNTLAARHKKKENRTDETKLPDVGKRGPGNVLP